MIASPASFSTIYAKTDFGHLEMQGAPALRRMLVLVDGTRSGKELSTMLVGQSTDLSLNDLVKQGCIAPVGTVDGASQSTALTASRHATASTAPTSDADLHSLPPAHTRSGPQADMARHFMINTVDMMFGQHTRIGLIEAISGCADTLALRAVYPLWVETISGSRTGAKRLPELRSKPFAVL